MTTKRELDEPSMEAFIAASEELETYQMQIAEQGMKAFTEAVEARNSPSLTHFASLMERQGRMLEELFGQEGGQEPDPEEMEAKFAEVEAELDAAQAALDDEDALIVLQLAQTPPEADAKADAIVKRYGFPDRGTFQKFSTVIAMLLDAVSNGFRNEADALAMIDRNIKESEDDDLEPEEIAAMNEARAQLPLYWTEGNVAMIERHQESLEMIL
ncbi:MAG: hypothetical protein AAFR04_02980 [Pseudomonadota bacterium]